MRREDNQIANGFLISFAMCCVFLIIYLIVQCGVNRINTKKDWYVEITNEYINLRSETNTYGVVYGKVRKGEKYKALEVKEDDTYFWYKIRYENDKEYWIANPKATYYLKDYNNPNDITAPILKFYDNTYKTHSIDTITYEHLEIIEDSTDYTLTHTVFKSEDNLYWITYTIKDKAGHSCSKTQQVIFEVEPIL